jgi:hypothetical protein
MIDNIGRTQRHGFQVWLAGSEGRRENDRMDVLGSLVSQMFNITEVEKGRSLRGTEEHRDHAQRCS